MPGPPSQQGPFKSPQPKPRKQKKGSAIRLWDAWLRVEHMHNVRMHQQLLNAKKKK